MNYTIIMMVVLVGLCGAVHPNEQQALPIQPLVQQQVTSGNNGLELRGCIKIENNRLDKVPEYRIYYQGREQRSNNEGLFSLPIEDRNIGKYSLVICKTIDQQFEQNNTIAHYGVIPDKEYRYFTFQRGPNRQWLAQEKRLTKKQFVIPAHAIVALIDPKCVDRLDPWDMNLADNVIKLPAIVLKKDIDQKKLMRYSAKSMLYSLDSRPFHDTQRFERKGIQNNPKVQLVLDR